MTVEIDSGKIILKPEPDAILIAIKGRKIARVTLEELERISIEEQKI